MRESHWASLAQYQPEKKSVLVFPDHLRRPAAARDVLGAQNRQRLSSHSPWCLFRWGQVCPPLLHCASTNSFICCQMTAGCGARPCAITATHHSSHSSPPLFFPPLAHPRVQTGSPLVGDKGTNPTCPPPTTSSRCCLGPGVQHLQGAMQCQHQGSTMGLGQEGTPRHYKPTQQRTELFPQSFPQSR